MKNNTIYCTKLIFTLAALTFSLFSSAESPEISALIQALNSEHTFTKAITDVNSHQLKKRLSIDSDSVTDNEKLIKFSRHIKSILDWKEIRPLLVEQYTNELNEEELRKLIAFFNTKEGQYYVNDFQYAAISIALTLDDYSDTIVDDFFDEDEKKLDVIKIEDKKTKRAKKLLQKITSPDTKAEFNSNRTSFIDVMIEAANTLPDLKENDALKSEKIKRLNKSFTFEQMQIRSATVLAQKMHENHINDLLKAISKDDIYKVLQKLGSANQKASQNYSVKLTGSADFISAIAEIMQNQ